MTKVDGGWNWRVSEVTEDKAVNGAAVQNNQVHHTIDSIYYL